MPEERGRKREKKVRTRNPKKIFVGRLAYRTTSESLQRYFTQYGEVKEAAVRRDKGTGKSRGFGLIEFDDTEGVKKTLAQS